MRFKKKAILIFFALLCISVCGFAESEQYLSSDGGFSVAVSAKTNSAGNIFFDGDEKNFEVTFKNEAAQNADFNVKYVVSGINGDTVFEKSASLSLGANGEKTENFPITVQKYGVYYFNVYLADESGNDTETYSYKFSLCPYADYAEYDSEIGVCPHFNWGRECVNGTEIIKKAGIDHIREGYNWANFERKKGVYTETDAMKNYLDAAENNGIDILALAAYGNTLYTGDSYAVPTTDEQRAAFANYVYNMLDKNHGRIKIVEIWNEPDIARFNTNNASPEDLAYLVKAVYDKIHTDFPSVEICAFALANAYNETGREWLERALKTDTDGDGEYDLYKYCGGISVHHYITDLQRISTDGEKLKTLLAKYGFADKKLYHTEFGYTEARRENGAWVLKGEETQAAYIAKYASSLRAKNAGDIFYIYDFSNDGLEEDEPEHNFGLVESVSYDVPYAAKAALIAVANMNRVIGDCAADEILSDSGSLSVYKFKNGIGTKESYIMFSESGAAVYDFAAQSGKTVFYDMYGNEMNFAFDGEKYTVNVGKNPIYAVVTFGDDICETYLENGKIVAEAKFENGNIGEYVGVKVFDKKGKIVYLNQFSLSEDKKIKFSFSSVPSESYSILIGMKSRSAVYRTDAEGTRKAKITLVKNGGEVNTLGSLLNGKITLYAEIFDRAYDTFTVAAAAYKNEILTDVKLIKKEDMTFDGIRFSYEILPEMFENADTAGFYIVNSTESVMPLAGGIKLK